MSMLSIPGVNYGANFRVFIKFLLFFDILNTWGIRKIGTLSTWKRVPSECFEHLTPRSRNSEILNLRILKLLSGVHIKSRPIPGDY